MTQYGFFFDQSRCYGCRTCSVACKDWYDMAPGPEKWMSVYEWETGTYPEPRTHIVAYACGHCDDPTCMTACPNDAIFKEDKYGAVLVDQDKCKGARACLEACPYGVPRYANDEPGTKMSKCTMCIDRLEEGMQPVCVLSCPMRALDFGPIEELRARYGELDQLEGMPDPETTHPNVVFKPHDKKQKLVPLDPVKMRLLAQPRGDLGNVFEDAEALENPPASLGIRTSLQMVNTTVAEVMEATANDRG